jgi:hypothetical protein
MSDSDYDPSIENEPQFRDRPFAPDPGDAPEASLRNYVDRSSAIDVDHSVWDEPTLAADLAGAPGPEQVTFARWLAEKMAATSYAKKRPYLFKSIWQILVAAAAGGLFFGVIENLIYLNIYIRSPTTQLVRWRWLVCTGLHLNCSFVAGVGLARIWDHAMRNRVPPQLGRGMPYFATAMLGHGLYNLTVSLAEVFGWLDFE